MRPVKLRIKGLNSFIDEQSIDFDKLTRSGLFGIFGPTGSGKSTILDGITLALYGNVARKSSNYINVNCDKANVNFEFSITTDKVSQYVVDREFRRQKKDDSIRAGKCRIIDKDTNDILAEGVKSVNKKVEEILGLNLDDFTRTVVLPQGKFSEFLKLEGKDRREMLERLFNLQKYGDVLSKKLAAKIYEEKDNNNILIGQLSGYEDVSEERLNDKNEELKKITEDLIKAEEQLKAIEDLFKQSEEVWNLHKELKVYKERENELKIKEEEIKAVSNKINLAEASGRVMPYLKSFETNSKEYERVKQDLDSLINLAEALKVKNDEAKEKFEYAKKEKDDKLPQYLIEEQKITEAIKEDKILKSILEKIKLLNEDMIRFKSKISNDEEDIKKEEEKLKIKNDEIKKNQNEYDSLKIDEEFKQKIQQAIINEQNLSIIEKNIFNYKSRKVQIDNENKEVIEKGKDLKAKFDEKQKEFKELSDKLIQIEKQPPCEKNDLLKLKEFIVVAAEKSKRYESLVKEIEESEKTINNLKNSLIPIKDKEKLLLNELEDLKKSKNKAIENNLAIQLRVNLKEGDACPVCGSLHHKDNINEDIHSIDISKIDEKIKAAESEIKELDRKTASDESNIKMLSEKILKNNEESESIKKDLNGKSARELEKELDYMSKALESYEKNRDEIKEKISLMQAQLNTDNGEINTLRAIIKKNRVQLENINKEIEENTKHSDEIKAKLKDLEEETKVSDFKKKNDEIKENEMKREKMEKILKIYRSEAEEIEKKKENLKNDLSSSKEKLASVNSNIESYMKNKEEKIESIKDKVGENKDLESLLTNLKAKINNINTIFNEAEKIKNSVEKEFNYTNEKLISCKTEKVQLEKIIDDNEHNLKLNMEKENFNNIDEVKSNYIEGHRIDEYKSQIESYKDIVSKVNGNIESLNKKINNRECSDEQYLKMKQDIENEKNIFNECNKNKIKTEEEVKDLKSKVKELEHILDKKKKLEHEMAVLSDLEKLFKGKKFIEFVAANQLKYISLEASKRLKQITHGTYGLKVDENGRFIIRDYKNGGVERDASTLSGGETFLASLALALALSAQIQLKGTAPLEFFFLDEGFGTLDDDLLEVVMSSLEEIHNDKLKVGIITHVEAIKDRVPVKLVVKPAECGLGGSKVRIETN